MSSVDEANRKRKRTDDDDASHDDEPTLMTMEEINRFNKRQWYHQNVSPNGPNGRRKYLKRETPGKVARRRQKRQEDRQHELAQMGMFVSANLQHSAILMEGFNQGQQTLYQHLGQTQNALPLSSTPSAPHNLHNAPHIVPVQSACVPGWSLPRHLDQNAVGQVVPSHRQYQYDNSNPYEPRLLEWMIAVPLRVDESHFGAPGDLVWFWVHDEIDEYRPGAGYENLLLPFTDDDIPSADGDRPSMDDGRHLPGADWTSSSSLALSTPQRGTASSPHTRHRSYTLDLTSSSSQGLQTSQGPHAMSTGASLDLTCVSSARTPTTSSFPPSGHSLSMIAQSPAGNAALRYVDTMEGGRNAQNLMAVSRFVEVDHQAAIAPIEQQNYHSLTVVHHQVLTATSSNELQRHVSTWKKWNWFLWFIQVVATAVFFIKSADSK